MIGKKNNYVTLFDAIDKQKEYDEKKITKEFINDKLTNNFSVAKAYLYQLIMKSMRNYHSEATIDRQLKEQLTDVEFLYEKKLYQHALKILTKAKQTAYNYEKDESLLEIISREKMIMSEMELLTDEKMIDQIVDENNNILKKLQNKSDYAKYIHQTLYFLEKKGKVRSNEEIKPLEKIMNNPLLKNEEMALSYQAKSSFYLIHAYYYWIKDDIDNYYTYCKLMLEHAEKYAKPFQLNIRNYHSSLYNFSVAQTYRKEYEGALHNLKKLRTIHNPKKNTRSILFLSYSAELGIYLKTGEFDKGIPVIDEIKSALAKKQGEIIKQRIILYDGISQIYFGLEEYSESLKWSNKILNNKENLRERFFCYVMLFNLLIHYELNNHNLLKHLIRSTYRFLHKQQHLYQFETAVLNFIRKLLHKAFDNKKLILLFKNLKTELIEITMDPFERKALDYFDFISWLDSKIERKSFAEMIREKC